ncbi:MAG: 1-acyl-sn-glycerol-3-phosphate acyltransferase [Flavobacteriales bacterium]|nr:1-acyl-sn-glycerol-3-phosphate acyltransferase [Flavobacteriales bacterium]
MSGFIRILRFTWAIYFLLLFIVFFLLFYPFFRIFLYRRNRYPIAHKLRAIWGRIIMFLSGLIPSTTYEEPLSKDQSYVFVANHFSYLDILSLNVQVHHYFRFMAKSELGNIPLFKIFFRTIDISVNRKSTRASAKAFSYANRALAEGDSLGIFPEGGIGESVPIMRRFKPGAFRMAVENNVPIVPVSILDNFKRMPGGGLDNGGTPGKMRVVVHKPIQTNAIELDEIPALMDQVYHIIQNTINTANFDGAENEDHGSGN